MIEAADSYYRVRALKIDKYDDFNLDWDKDIIFSGHPIEYFAGEPIEMKTLWRVEIIELAQDELVRQYDDIPTREDAESLLKTVRDDLHELSRLEFIARYLVEDDETPEEYFVEIHEE